MKIGDRVSFRIWKTKLYGVITSINQTNIEVLANEFTFIIPNGKGQVKKI